MRFNMDSNFNYWIMKLTQSQIFLELDKLNDPWLMILIGPPGVGKSTFTSALQREHSFHIASTDDIIERLALEHGLSYNEVFDSLAFKDVKKEMIGSMHAAFIRRENVLNDQTNMSAKKRQTTLSYAPSDYKKLALSFHASTDVLAARLAKRQAATGKKIGMGIVTEMLRIYTPPTKSEGFHEIWELIGDST
jgi:predicted kinase